MKIVRDRKRINDEELVDGVSEVITYRVARRHGYDPSISSANLAGFTLGPPRRPVSSRPLRGARRHSDSLSSARGTWAPVVPRPLWPPVIARRAGARRWGRSASTRSKGATSAHGPREWAPVRGIDPPPSPRGLAQPSNQAAEDHRSHPEEMARCLWALQIT